MHFATPEQMPGDPVSIVLCLDCDKLPPMKGQMRTTSETTSKDELLFPPELDAMEATGKMDFKPDEAHSHSMRQLQAILEADEGIEDLIDVLRKDPLFTEEHPVNVPPKGAAAAASGEATATLNNQASIAV